MPNLSTCLSIKTLAVTFLFTELCVELAQIYTKLTLARPYYQHAFLQVGSSVFTVSVLIAGLVLDDKRGTLHWMVSKAGAMIISCFGLAVVVHGMLRGGHMITRPCPKCDWRISSDYVEGAAYVMMAACVLLLQLVAFVVYVKYYWSLRVARAERMVKLERSADIIFGSRSSNGATDLAR